MPIIIILIENIVKYFDVHDIISKAKHIKLYSLEV